MHVFNNVRIKSTINMGVFEFYVKKNDKTPVNNTIAYVSILCHLQHVFMIIAESVRKSNKKM